MFKGKIDRLAKLKNNLDHKKEMLDRKMKERNSRRETRIKVIENKSMEDFENTNRSIVNIERRIDKIVREINSEQIYVSEVAQSETSKYLTDKKEKENKKQLKK